MYQVATLLYPRALATSVTLPTEILAAAAQMAQGGNAATEGTGWGINVSGNPTQRRSNGGTS